MGSGVTRIMTGSCVGTGSAMNIDSVGFRPRRVVLENVTGLVTASWTDNMADASAVKRVTAGDMTFITTLGVTPRAKGFTIGADTDINVSGEVIHWTAFE